MSASDKDPDVALAGLWRRFVWGRVAHALTITNAFPGLRCVSMCGTVTITDQVVHDPTTRKCQRCSVALTGASS